MHQGNPIFETHITVAFRRRERIDRDDGMGKEEGEIPQLYGGGLGTYHRWQQAEVQTGVNGQRLKYVSTQGHVSR